MKLIMMQWLSAVCSVNTMICFQAFVLGDVFDVSMEGAGIVPTLECRLDDGTGLRHVMELLLLYGGFSGWSHVTRFMQSLVHFLMTTLALDVDLRCVLAHHLTFGATLIGPDLQVQFDEDDCLPLSRAVEHDILEFEWVHLLCQCFFDLGICSPPCPPWSKVVASPPGLRRNDGAFIPLAVALMVLVSCRAFCLENMVGLMQHEHLHVVVRGQCELADPLILGATLIDLCPWLELRSSRCLHLLRVFRSFEFLAVDALVVYRNFWLAVVLELVMLFGLVDGLLLSKQL